MVHGPSGSPGQEERWDHRPLGLSKTASRGGRLKRDDGTIICNLPVSTALFMKVAAGMA